MLSQWASLGAAAWRCTLSGAVVSTSFELCAHLEKLSSQFVLRRSACQFHTQTQDHAVSSCRIPSPVVPDVHGDVQLCEGLSAVDGPGLRYLVVLASRNAQQGSQVSSKAVANELCHLRPYLLQHGGGVSVASSIPSLADQAQFCSSIFKEAHALDLSTCLHTTAMGAADADLDDVLHHTDIVGLELKPLHCPSDLFNRHKEWGVDSVAQLSHQLQQLRIPFFLRYVLIPGATDQPHDIATLFEVAKFLKPNLQGIQLLPYHVLSGERWHGMGFDQLLKGRMQPFKIEVVEKLAQQMNDLGFKVSLSLKPC